MQLRDRRDEVLESEGLATWLTAVASRDTDALALLYGQTSPQLMAVLLRLLRRRELAEEVLHDVYLRIWDRAGTFDPSKGSPMGWLVSVARNAALDHYRRHRREVVGVEGDVATTAELNWSTQPIWLVRRRRDVRCRNASISWSPSLAAVSSWPIKAA